MLLLQGARKTTTQQTFNCSTETLEKGVEYVQRIGCVLHIFGGLSFTSKRDNL